METQEKLRYRAWLLAIGADRWYDCTDRIERMKIVEILEGEFAQRPQADPWKKSAFLQKHGIVISDLPVQVKTPTYLEEEHNVDLVQGKRECSRMKKDETQGLPVQPAAALDAQEQRKSGTSQTGRMSRTPTNGYFHGADSEPVHHSAPSNAREQQSTGHKPCEAPSRRVTKDTDQRGGPAHAEEAGEIYKHLDSRGWTGSWTWRQWNYNRVPPALEAAVYERFKQGWSKSKLAREFRLNRRTIIRICKAWQEAGPPV